MVAFEGAKKRKAKEPTTVVPVESGAGETADKPQIQVLDSTVDAEEDDEDANTYRRNTVCNL